MLGMSPRRLCEQTDGRGSSMVLALKAGMWACLEEVLLQLVGNGTGFKAGVRLQALRLPSKRQGSLRVVKGVGSRVCGH